MSTNSLISPQFLRSGEIFVTIVKVNDPGNYIIKEYTTSPEGMKFLEFEKDMQNYYNTIEASFFELPHSGKIVAVRFESKYFRAKVQKVIQGASNYILIVYLLDYGKECNVPHNCCYQLPSDFLKQPYQAAYFKLADIHPISLVLNPLDITVTYGIVETWDPSSIIYVEKLLKAMDSAYITVKGVESNCLVGSLYITLCDGDLRCLNTDLIDNKFAQHSSACMKTVKPHSEISSDCSFKTDSSCKKMTTCNASNVNEFNKNNQENETKIVTTKVTSPSNKFQQLLKLCQKEETPMTLDNLKCTNDVLTDFSSQPEGSTANSVSVTTKELSNKLKSVLSEDHNRFECNAPISEEKSANEIKDMSSNVPSSTASLSQAKSSTTVDRLKKFLSQSTVLQNSDTECALEDAVQTKKDDFSNNYIGSKNSDVLEELIKESISENDPDDLLQIALDPNKKKISSDNESNSQTETDFPSNNPDRISDFSRKSLWEERKVPALCLGEAVPAPVLSVDETTFVPEIKGILEKIRFYGPSSIQSVVWPAMSRSRNLAAIAPPHSGKTVSYLLPLVSNIIGGEFYQDIPKGKGPIAIILCSSWKKIQAVYDYFHIFCGSSKIKIVTLYADGKSKRSKINAITSGCDVLIAVPSCLLELFNEKAIDIYRCCHFILDDGNTLLSFQKKCVTEVMLHLKEGIRLRSTISVPFQIVICAERWTRGVASFVDKLMILPLLLFTSFLEAAIYAQIPMKGHFCHQNKIKKLLEIVHNTSRTVICTSSKVVASDLHTELKSENIRSYLVTEDMAHYISKGVIQDWKSVKLSSVPFCLVITDAALTNTPISDAKYLIHYDVPEVSRLQFGNRFCCVAENFQQSNSKSKCYVHVLISKESSLQAAPLLKIINRSGGEYSVDFKEFAEQQSKVLQNSNVEICHYFKAYGSCDSSNCQLRHHIDSTVDEASIIPKEGDVHCLVTHVFNANHFYVKILNYLLPNKEQTSKSISLSGTYVKIGFQLAKIYSVAENKQIVTDPMISGSYVFEDKNLELFYRVKVLNIIQANGHDLKQYVLAFQDEGWVKTYNSCQCHLFHLVKDINLPPPVAAEVYLCGVKPPDTCLEWNFQATNFIQNLILEREVHGKIVLCLNNTLWLHPVAIREKLLFINDYINKMTLHKALIEHGYATENKCHLPKLYHACKGKIDFPEIIESTDFKMKEDIEQVQVSYAFLDINMYEDVYVSSIVSPHQFYVQRAKFVKCLDELLDKINENVENKSLKKCQHFHKGLHCIAPFSEDNKYYRAVITDIHSNDEEVHLFFVDFGDTGLCNKTSIYSLPPEFLLLPFQAIECDLDGIHPAHGGWSEKTVDSFYFLTRDDAGDMKILQLKAYKKTTSYSGGYHYVVDVYDNEKSLSDHLIKTGLVELKEKLSDSFQNSSIQCEEKAWDEIPEGFVDSFDDDEEEELSSEEKDGNALFCAALARLMLQGNKPQFEKDKFSNLASDITLNDQFKTVDNNSEQTNEMQNEFNSSKVSPLENLRRLLKVSSKNQLKSIKSQLSWWDTKEKLYLLIRVENIKIYELDLRDDGFNFKTSLNNVEYNADEVFFSKVNSKDASTTITPEGLQIILCKEIVCRWPRLIKESLKLPHIKYDLKHIDESDSEKETYNISTSKEATEVAPYDSDDLEDDASDDYDDTYVQSWKELSEYKDNFNPMT